MKRIIEQAQASLENIENMRTITPQKATRRELAEKEGLRARASVNQVTLPVTPTSITKPRAVTDLIVERKENLSQLISLLSLRKQDVVECVDMIISPLASMQTKEAFFSEAATPRDIASHSKSMWEFITGTLDEAKIDMAKAIPSHRLGLSVPFDTNVRTHPGFYKLRVDAKYQKIISAQLTANCVVAGWPEQPDTDVFFLDRKWHASKIMEQIFIQFGVNSTPSTIGAPRGMRGYRVSLSAALRTQTEGTLDLGALGKFTAVPVSDRVNMETMYVTGPTGEMSAKLDFGKALAQYLGVSSDLLNFTRVRETPRGVIVLAVEYPYSQEAYDEVAELFDVGHYSVVNSRKPHLKPIEVFVANSVLELQQMTGLKCVAAIQDKPQAEMEEIVEIDMTPAKLMGPSVEAADDVDRNVSPAEPPDVFLWIPWDSHPTFSVTHLDGSAPPPPFAV